MADTSQAKRAMEKALAALDREFAQLACGRPTPKLLEGVMVDYYGTPTPVTQLAAVKTPEAHLMVVEPWDKGIVGAVEKAIAAANIGVTPNNDGSGVIRLPFPPPTEERRVEVVKECRAAAERARVAVRGARRDAKNAAEREEKAGDITEDELRRFEGELQKLTDSYVGKVDAALEAKEAEVMEI